VTAQATAPRLDALRDELRRHYGWELPASRLRELGRLAEGANTLDVLAEELAIGETCFFRDRKVFHALERVVLPDLIRARMGTTRTISIWSAGCATG
jgi:chemotaxis methyl-accepting protein methylase